MDGRKKKLPMSRVAQAAMRLLLAEDGYEIRKIDEPKYLKSERRRWNQTINKIIKAFHFSKKEEELLRVLNAEGPLDINQIAEATSSKAPRALIEATRGRIASTQYLRDVMAIGIFNQGRKRLYYLKFTDSSANTNSLNK